MPSITVVAPSEGATVSGVADVVVRVEGTARPDAVEVVIGPPEYGTRTARPVGGGLYRYSWNTARKLVDERVPSPCDALFWITAKGVVDGETVRAPYRPVVTANRPDSAAVRAAADGGGWREQLWWSADYSGSLERWRKSNFAVIGASYAQLVDDPVLGASRRVVRVSVPDSAYRDADQPNTTTVRFQSSSRRVLREGDEFCVGFSYLLPADFPSVYPVSDPLNPRGKDATGYIALFQMYGPPYDQGAPFVLHANRRSVDDPLDEVVVRGNELNAGDPVPLLSLPYRRGRWTDVVFRFRASASIRHGWVETYVNQGEGTAVRLLEVAPGLTRVPRVLLRSDSEAFRSDVQQYRVRGRIARVTNFHTGHKVGPTVQSVDPGSYAGGSR